MPTLQEVRDAFEANPDCKAVCFGSSLGKRSRKGGMMSERLSDANHRETLQDMFDEMLDNNSVVYEASDPNTDRYELSRWLVNARAYTTVLLQYLDVARRFRQMLNEMPPDEFIRFNNEYENMKEAGCIHGFADKHIVHWEDRLCSHLRLVH